MAFFSFSLLKDSFTYLSKQIEPNQKYYSKDIALWKALNNRNKLNPFCSLKFEIRLNITNIGKKILFCLPPNFGLGDSIEYGIAIKSIIDSKKFDKIGIAFCNNHIFIFKKFFSFLDVYPLFISDKQLKNYDTVFHITLEIGALNFQKYKRSNIAEEICKYFQVPLLDFKINKNNISQNNTNTISIFPVSTSVIRSLPYNILKKIIDTFIDKYEIKIIIDDSLYSKFLLQKNNNTNCIFIKPKNIESLILEVSKINFGIFVDSGPLHVAKIFNKKGILVETSVSSEILLTNSESIYSAKNKYKSKYCYGPCGLVDVFSFENTIGCYETNKVSFENIKTLTNIKKLQRWNKRDNNSHFFLNPVGCVKAIDEKNIIKLIKNKIKIKEY